MLISGYLPSRYSFANSAITMRPEPIDRQGWYIRWTGAIRLQAITWINVNQVLWCHMAPGANVLKQMIGKTTAARSAFTTVIILTHWGWVIHKCISKVTITGSDNGLSPGRSQAIIWTNTGIWLIGTLQTNFSEILIQIHIFSLKKMRLKRSSAKWRPFCHGLNVLKFRIVCPGWCGYNHYQLCWKSSILHPHMAESPF